MKKYLILLVASFLFASLISKAQTGNMGKAASSALNGAWSSVDGREFSVMNDGYFSSIAKDSMNLWKNTHAGTYILDNNNSMTLRLLYSSFPYRIGSVQTVDYELNGDTLTIKWFKKLLDPKGTDITAQMPKNTLTKFTRAKF